MRISYTGEAQNLRKAAAFANELAGTEEFWRQIREKPKFDYTSLTSAQIEQRLRGAGTELKIKMWRPGNPAQRFTYRNTVAFVDHAHPHHLFYHEKFIGNSVDELVHTFVHEYVHDVDYHSDGSALIDMGHGSNNPKGKEESAPYWIGNLAQRLYGDAVGRSGLLEAPPPSLVNETGDAGDGEIVPENSSPLGTFAQEATPG
jgi:hypothetical protein